MLIDPYISLSFFHSKLADNCYSTYMRRKKVSVVSPRDFCMVTYIHEHQDNSGDISIVQFSAPQSECLEEQEEITRGVMHL